MAEQKIDRYIIKGKLGKGAMALVLHAYDPRFQRDVALKVLHRRFANDKIVRQRFIQEARTIGKLDHPAIVPIYDAAQDGNYVFLVMRLMEKETLLDRIESRGSLPPEEIIPIVERLSSALDAAHEAGIVHRDVKPENIMFDRYGAAYLADFGIVKVLDDNVKMTTDALIGSPAYMSPEQVNGDEDIDGRSDIYSLGAVLYEMLTGRLPYSAKTAMQMATQHVTKPVPRLKAHSPDLNKKWQRVITKSMAKKPADRYGTGADMAAAVTQAGSNGGGRQFLTQRQRYIALMALFALLIPISIAWGLFNQRQQANDIADARAALALNQTATVEQQIILDAQATALVEAANEAATQSAIDLMETGTAIAAEIMGDVEVQSAAMETSVAQTMVAIMPTETPLPTDTPTPVPTPTPTLEEVEIEEVDSGVPRVEVSLSSVNLREGPGRVYDAVGFVESGAELAIVGRNGAADWYEVALENGETAWIAKDAVLLVDVTPEAIAMGQVPLLPTATPTSKPTSTPTRVSTATPNFSATQTRESAESNFKGTQTAQAVRSMTQVAANAQATQTRQAAESNFQATQTAQAQAQAQAATRAAATQAAQNAVATQAARNRAATSTAQSIQPSPTTVPTTAAVATAAPTAAPTTVAPTAVPTEAPAIAPTVAPTAASSGGSSSAAGCNGTGAFVKARVRWGTVPQVGATLNVLAFQGGASFSHTTDAAGIASFCVTDLGKWRLNGVANTQFGTATTDIYSPGNLPVVDLQNGSTVNIDVQVALNNSFAWNTPVPGTFYPSGIIDMSWAAPGYPNLGSYYFVWVDNVSLYDGDIVVPGTQTSTQLDLGIPNFEKSQICFKMRLTVYDTSGIPLGFVGSFNDNRFCVQQ